MIHFYFYVFETTSAIHCPMKISFPPLQHAAALVGCFPRINRQFTIENIRMKKVNNSKKPFISIIVSALFPAQSIPFVNHTYRVEPIVFLSTNQKD